MEGRGGQGKQVTATRSASGSKSSVLANLPPSAPSCTLFFNIFSYSLQYCFEDMILFLQHSFLRFSRLRSRHDEIDMLSCPLCSRLNLDGTVTRTLQEGGGKHVGVTPD